MAGQVSPPLPLEEDTIHESKFSNAFSEEGGTDRGTPAAPSPTLLLYRIASPALIAHFKSPTYLKGSTLRLLESRVLRQLLTLTSPSTKPEDALKQEEVRQQMGNDAVYWEEFANLMKAAIPSLERRSFGIWDPSGVDYDSPSGTLISQNSAGLYLDLEYIMRNVVSISRNVLTARAGAEQILDEARAGQKRTRCGKVKCAQDLAAEQGADEEVMRVIRCCVRVGARGFDGPSDRNNSDDPDSANSPEGNSADNRASDEEKWAQVVGAYKRILITSLQWLNNFVAKNEHNKTLLFAKLFCDDAPAAPTGQTDLAGRPELVSFLEKPEWPVDDDDLLRSFGVNTKGEVAELHDADPTLTHDADYAAFFERHKGVHEQIKELAKVLEPDSPQWPKFLVGLAEAGGIGGFAHLSKQTPTDMLLEGLRSTLKREPTTADWCSALQQRWTVVLQTDRQNQADAKDGEDSVPMQASWSSGWARIWDDYFRQLELWHAQQERLAAHLFSHTTEDVSQSSEDKIWWLWEERLWDEYGTLSASSTIGPDPDLPSPLPEQIDGPITKRELRKLTEQQTGFTASAGKKLLESGKMELMKRLEPPVVAHTRNIISENLAPLGDDSFVTESRPGRGAQPNKLAPDIAGATGATVSDDVQTKHDIQDPENVVYDTAMDGQGLDEDGSPISPDRSDGGIIGDEEEDSEGDEDQEASMAGSTEDGRGLLTDVPLILGPSEIEVLPMLIMSCIVPAPPSPRDVPAKLKEESDEAYNARREREDDEFINEQRVAENSAALRTRILLSTVSGRNLLRELLIFVAAWDLQTHELYFGFITHIIYHVVRLGLGGYCYWILRDRSRSRDIISPAQGVMVKVLGSIWRNRNETAKVAAAELEDLRSAKVETSRKSLGRNAKRDEDLEAKLLAALPTKADLATVSHILSTFRQHTIPQTCALIFLQGQIARGRAIREDFPLNLWDMERMYEGVYGGVEVWGVLSEDIGPVGRRTDLKRLVSDRSGRKPASDVVGTEDDAEDLVTWKDVLTEWELVSELVTLLKELESGIVRKTLHGLLTTGNSALATSEGRFSSAPTSQPQPTLPLVASSLEKQGQHFPPPTRVVPSQPVTSNAEGFPDVKPPVAIERPYDREPGTTLPPLQNSRNVDAAVSNPPSGQFFEPQTPLTYPETLHSSKLAYPGAQAAVQPPSIAPEIADSEGIHYQPSQAYTPYASEDTMVYNGRLDDEDHEADRVVQDDPSAYEWRNLKKLTVLVLSSLVWKNPTAQKQVREVGGLEVLVQCAFKGGSSARLSRAYADVEQCATGSSTTQLPDASGSNSFGAPAAVEDSGNAGLKEHAQMCLKFAIEGCEENARYVANIQQQQQTGGNAGAQSTAKDQ